MKKYILVGVVLILAGLLWFLIMPSREGLDNPACWELPLDASSGRFVDLFEASMSIRRKYAITLDQAKSECAADSNCNGVVSGPGPGGDNVYSSYNGSPAIVPINVSPLPAMGNRVFYAKKACAPPAAPPRLAPPNLTGDWIVEGYTFTGKIVQDERGNWQLTPSSAASGWSLITGTFTSDTSGTLVYVTPDKPQEMLTFTVDSAGKTITVNNGRRFTRAPTPTPPAAPAPAPPPAAPLATASATDPQIGTLISLLQQDIMGRKSSLLNTANNPAVPVGSLLAQTTVDPNWKPIPNATIPGPNFSGMNSRGPLDEIPKSSLVPCTCPTYTMSCPVHAGSRPSSQAPGDADSALSRAQDQYDMMRPFNKTDDVPGFLNTFSNFGN